MTTRTQGSPSLALGLTLTVRANHSFQLPVDACKFSNFIPAPLTRNSPSTNYASMP
jgi:hypothetical protein